MDKKDLLKAVLNKKITLIDYENIRDSNGGRYLGFGRFAGIIGCYNSLSLYKKKLNNFNLPRAYDLGTYSKLKEYIKRIDFSNMKILITGDGRVAKGVLELLKYTNLKKISKKDYIEKKIHESVFCHLKTSDYVSFNDNNKFILQHFIKNPEKYISNAHKYLEKTNLLISAHYWDPRSPKIFELKHLNKFNYLKVIGDITCDINGSIPTTLKSTTIEEPYFYYDKKTNSETKILGESLAVMAVDNLPSELPKDSSEEFGDGIVKEVIPYLINDDDRILNATIAKNGNFLPKYLYLNDYISN